MTRLRAALAPMAALVLLLLVAAPALAAPNDGVVTGKVTNGTKGGTSPAGDVVHLLRFSVAQKTAVGEDTTKVGPDGTFTFSGVDRNPDLAYYVVADHGGNTYSFQTPFQLKDQKEEKAQITVFDTTGSESALRYDALNLLVNGADPGMVHVMEMGTITNAGDRTFVSPNPGNGPLTNAVRFALPKGALNASFQTGFSDQDVVPYVGGLQVVSPLPPGAHQFAISFDVPYSGSGADLSVQAPYPVSTFQMYVPRGSYTLDARQLATKDIQQLGGQSYMLYAASGVAPNTVLSLNVGGLPSPGGSAFSQNQLAIMSLGIVLVVGGAGVLAYTLRRERRGAVAEPASEQPAALEQERRRLVLQLALLDERHAQGDLPTGEYEQLRAREKARLLDLTRAVHGA